MSIAPSRELLPRRALYRPGEPIGIEVRGTVGPGPVDVFRLGERVHRLDWPGAGDILLPPLAEGGYSVTLGDLQTAIDIRADDRARLRYGFVASYAPGKAIGAVGDTVRRLHLDAIQFYDWAYRHADLMGGGETYRDALDQPISLDTVRLLVREVQAANARALGYAAVYAVGPKEWPAWQHLAVNAPDGAPYALGDFLFILDPAAEEWRSHFTADLGKASAALGFDGYHLDQYGYPKRARRADGAPVDMARSFLSLIEAVRAALPEAHLIFNNVNDFPTRLTATAPQDALYIEPWEPQLTLQDLADTATRARAFGQGKPVTLAAYQHVYDKAPRAEADRATALTMAALFSHGATQLLAGEADRLLCDPYYVRNHVIAPETADLLKRWYDFLVAHDALLLAPEVTDVTNAYAGAYNGELDVVVPGQRLSLRAEAGTIWRRVTETEEGLVLHLINLLDQPDTLWDQPRAPFTPVTGHSLSFRLSGNQPPRVDIADPDGAGRLIPMPVSIEGNVATAALPPFATWQLIRIRP